MAKIKSFGMINEFLNKYNNLKQSYEQSTITVTV